MTSSRFDLRLLETVNFSFFSFFLSLFSFNGFIYDCTRTRLREYPNPYSTGIYGAEGMIGGCEGMGCE